jgi:hypothetical protein
MRPTHTLGAADRADDSAGCPIPLTEPDLGAIRTTAIHGLTQTTAFGDEAAVVQDLHVVGRALTKEGHLAGEQREPRPPERRRRALRRRGRTAVRGRWPRRSATRQHRSLDALHRNASHDGRSALRDRGALAQCLLGRGRGVADRRGISTARDGDEPEHHRQPHSDSDYSRRVHRQTVFSAQEVKRTDDTTASTPPQRDSSTPLRQTQMTGREDRLGGSGPPRAPPTYDG